MDEREATDPLETELDDEPIRDDDPMDKYDDAVIAADATGMLAAERLVVHTEIDEHINDSPSE